MILSKKGFTLIEFLVVTLVFSSISSIILGILTYSLRGTSKTDMIHEVRVNGNQAINQMAKLIGYAQKFEGVSSDDSNYIINCTVPMPIPPESTSTPAQYKHVKIISNDGIAITFSCDSDGE